MEHINITTISTKTCLGFCQGHFELPIRRGLSEVDEKNYKEKNSLSVGHVCLSVDETDGVHSYLRLLEKNPWTMKLDYIYVIQLAVPFVLY